MTVGRAINAGKLSRKGSPVYGGSGLERRQERPAVVPKSASGKSAVDAGKIRSVGAVHGRAWQKVIGGQRSDGVSSRRHYSCGRGAAKDKRTVMAGCRELEGEKGPGTPVSVRRQRRPGAGRKEKAKQDPKLVKAIERSEERRVGK